MQIWKYTLWHGVNPIAMPDGARVVHFDIQAGVYTMWALVTPGPLVAPRQFMIFGTGHDIPEHAEYIATAQQPPFVWHLFELRNVGEHDD